MNMDRKRRNAGYDEPPSKKGRDGGDNNRDTEHLRKIFIGGLSMNTTEETLKSHFGEWGEIVDCVVMRDPNSKRSRGFGFVTYKFQEDVDKAQGERPHEIDGKEVETKRATPREESNKPEARMSIKKVFVGGIKEDLEEEDLQEYFSQYGEIKSVDIITEKSTGKKRGFAFILFDDYDPVDKIVLKRSHFIKNHRCDVKKALSKDEMQKAKEKEMQMNARGNFGNDRDFGRGMGDRMGGGMGGGFGGRDMGGRGEFNGYMGGNDMGGRGGRGNMGGDSDFRGGRGGFGGNQSNGFGQGGGYGNQGGNQMGGGYGGSGNFNQGGQGYNQGSQGWGSQGGNAGGGGGWGNQGNQGSYGNQGMGNMGNQGGGWGSQSSGGYGNQGGGMGGGNQGYGGGYNDNFQGGGNYGSGSGGGYNQGSYGGGGGGGYGGRR